MMKLESAGILLTVRKMRGNKKAAALLRSLEVARDLLSEKRVAEAEKEIIEYARSLFLQEGWTVECGCGDWNHLTALYRASDMDTREEYVHYSCLCSCGEIQVFDWTLI